MNAKLPKPSLIVNHGRLVNEGETGSVEIACRFPFENITRGTLVCLGTTVTSNGTDIIVHKNVTRLQNGATCHCHAQYNTNCNFQRTTTAKINVTYKATISTFTVNENNSSILVSKGEDVRFEIIVTSNPQPYINIETEEIKDFLNKIGNNLFSEIARRTVSVLVKCSLKMLNQKLKFVKEGGLHLLNIKILGYPRPNNWTLLYGANKQVADRNSYKVLYIEETPFIGTLWFLINIVQSESFTLNISNGILPVLDVEFIIEEADESVDHLKNTVYPIIIGVLAFGVLILAIVIFCYCKCKQGCLKIFRKRQRSTETFEMDYQGRIEADSNRNDLNTVPSTGDRDESDSLQETSPLLHRRNPNNERTGLCEIEDLKSDTPLSPNLLYSDNTDIKGTLRKFNVVNQSDKFHSQEKSPAGSFPSSGLKAVEEVYHNDTVPKVLVSMTGTDEKWQSDILLSDKSSKFSYFIDFQSDGPMFDSTIDQQEKPAADSLHSTGMKAVE
ncbi:hypothetical protein BgiMline_031405, partial [Biomphalaria glabrata]